MTSNTNENWNNRLRSAREARGLTRAALAELCGKTSGVIQDWETGRIKSLQTANAVLVASKLGIDLQWLINGTGTPPVHMKIENVDENQKNLIREVNRLMQLAAEDRHKAIVDQVRLLSVATDDNLNLIIELTRWAFAAKIDLSAADLIHFLNEYVNSSGEKRM